MLAGPEQLLDGLARADERLLEAVMAPVPTAAADDPLLKDALDRRTRTLVCLAALLALGASTDSIQWAVERASTAGACVDTVAGVLLASAPAVGGAGLVETAPRLALALGFDLKLAGWDGS